MRLPEDQHSAEAAARDGGAGTGLTLWRPAIVAGVLMALCFIRALSWQLIDQGPSAQKLTPRGEHLLVAACLAMPIFPALALLWAAITRQLKRRLTITLVLMILVGAIGAGVTSFLGFELFDGGYKASSLSPDGQLEAHLHVGGLLGCRGSIYVSEPRGVWGTFVSEKSVSCEDIGMQWTDAGIEITGSPPEPFNLGWGPH